MASFLPDDFDPSIIDDDSKLPADALGAMRELAWRQSKADAIWFMEKFWWCMNPFTFKWEQFKPRDYQREDLRSMVVANRSRSRKVILKARQIGWTTEAAAFAFHDAFFTDNHPWLISSQGEDEAKDTLSTKIKQPYARLPLWMRSFPQAPRPIDDNAETFSFDNGSRIMSVPATSSAARSKAVHGALVDEYAYVGDAQGLLTALDPLCYGPMFVFSTADGMGNPFHALWLESQTEDAEWEGRFHPWHVVPERGPFFKDEDGVLTSKWYQREKRKYRGREHEFYQENPASPEEAFAKSGRTVLPLDIIRESGEIVPPTWRFHFNNGIPKVPLSAELLDSQEPDEWATEELWVWEPPSVARDEKGRVVQKPNYVIGVDVAEGLPHGDRSSITVVNANTGETAATYRGYWEVEELGELVEWIAYGYFEALILVERNNHGMLPLDYLRRHLYPRLYRMASLAAIQITDRTPRFGWITTGGSKPKLVFDLIKSIKDGAFAIHDDRFLQEGQTFISNGKGGFGATPGGWDDHIISHGIAWQGVMEVGQYPITWHDDTPNRVTFATLAKLGKPEKVNPIDVPIGRHRYSEGTRGFVA